MRLQEKTLNLGNLQLSDLKRIRRAEVEGQAEWDGLQEHIGALEEERINRLSAAAYLDEIPWIRLASLKKSIEEIASQLKVRKEWIERHLSWYPALRAADRRILTATADGETGGLQHGIDLISDLLVSIEEEEEASR